MGRSRIIDWDLNLVTVILQTAFTVLPQKSVQNGSISVLDWISNGEIRLWRQLPHLRQTFTELRIRFYKIPPQGGQTELYTSPVFLAGWTEEVEVHFGGWWLFAEG